MAKFKKEDMLEIECGDIPEGFEIVHEGDYVSSGKWERKETIFYFDGKYYRLSSARSGSYWSDYLYESEDWPDEVECPEVEKAEKVTTYWRVV